MIEKYLKLKNEEKFSYDFFYRGGKNMRQNDFRPFRKIKRNGKVQYEGSENRNYVPYNCPVSYEVKNLKNITAVGVPGKYKRKGYAVSSGKMHQKKILYIIPEIDEEKEPFQIPNKDLEAFKIDHKKRENKLVDRDRAN